ncbi:MAG: endonuclease III [Oscillospiraceae bacterium]|jgi:endonuclease-3|nr:endonuclease III [Oscillospiraceae bacterium]
MTAQIPTDVAAVIAALTLAYPDADCTLDYVSPFQLLVATRLAAQCTDKRVNMVTPELFAHFPDAQSMSGADTAEIEAIIHPCGLAPTKASNISEMSKTLLRDFGGVVPGTIEELLKLPGVGRKTANLILGEVFGDKNAVVVDTHCTRLSYRLRLTDNHLPEKIEKDLRAILPEGTARGLCHRFVEHGRQVCTARSPRCTGCTLTELCPKRL